MKRKNRPVDWRQKYLREREERQRLESLLWRLGDKLDKLVIANERWNEMADAHNEAVNRCMELEEALGKKE